MRGPDRGEPVRRPEAPCGPPELGQVEPLRRILDPAVVPEQVAQRPGALARPGRHPPAHGIVERQAPLLGEPERERGRDHLADARVGDGRLRGHRPVRLDVRLPPRAGPHQLTAPVEGGGRSWDAELLRALGQLGVELPRQVVACDPLFTASATHERHDHGAEQTAEQHGYVMPSRSSSVSSPRHERRTRTERSRCTRLPSSRSSSRRAAMPIALIIRPWAPMRMPFWDSVSTHR